MFRVIYRTLVGRRSYFSAEIKLVYFTTLELLEPHHQIVSCHIRDTHWAGVLPLFRDTVAIFYCSSITRTSPSDCFVSYTGHSLGGGLTPLQRCTWCILHLQHYWSLTIWLFRIIYRTLFGMVSYPSAKTQLVYFTAPALLEPHHPIVSCHIQDTLWTGVLPLCRDIVGIFYISSITGTSPSDCFVSYTGHSLGWCLTPLQRYSWYILQLQHYMNLTLRLFRVIYRTLIGRVSYPSAEMHLVYFTAPVDLEKILLRKNQCIFWCHSSTNIIMNSVLILWKLLNAHTIQPFSNNLIKFSLVRYMFRHISKLLIKIC